MEKYTEFKKFSEYLAKLSGKIIKKHFRSPISVESKNDNSPVTVADITAEEIMRAEIEKEYPDHGIIGEEFGTHNPSAEFKWVIDPIDGTKSFICGAVNFGTLIALLRNDEPIFGVFNQPILNEFLLGDNHVTLLNGQKSIIRECEKISAAVLLTTDHLNVEKYQNARKFDSLIRKVKIYRGWGDCYGYYLLATGFADIMIDPIMSLWDIAAIVPIIRGAGGVITDYKGNDPFKGNSIIAASPIIHPQIIQELNQH